jgi:GTPase Era involved in 16S rRNA processing
MIIKEYKKNNIKIHSYIWTYINPQKKSYKKIILRKNNKNIKKINFILRFYH